MLVTLHARGRTGGEIGRIYENALTRSPLLSGICKLPNNRDSDFVDCRVLFGLPNALEYTSRAEVLFCRHIDATIFRSSYEFNRTAIGLQEFGDEFLELAPRQLIELDVLALKRLEQPVRMGRTARVGIASLALVVWCE